MKREKLLKRLLLGMLALSLGLTGCGETSEPAVAQSAPARVSIDVRPDGEVEEAVLVRTGTLVAVRFIGFEPSLLMSLKLTSPSSATSDPMATGRLNDNGNGQLTFFVPAEWDNGEPVREQELILLIRSADGTVEMKVDLQNQGN